MPIGLLTRHAKSTALGAGLVACALVAITFGFPGIFASPYHDLIQEHAEDPLEGEMFAGMEEIAYGDFKSVEHYYELARTFAQTTEKVWGIVYGEVYANLTKDDMRRRKTGRNIFKLYRKSIKFMGENRTSVRLSKHIEKMGSAPSFERNYQDAVAVSLGSYSGNAGITIHNLYQLRRAVLETWEEEAYPMNDLMKWHQRLMDEGHFRAYHYWLFSDARTEEAEVWKGRNWENYAAFTTWHQRNKLRLTSPSFHRIHEKMKGRKTIASDDH